MTSAITMAASTRTASRIAALRLSVAWACTDLVTDAVASLMTCSAMSSVVWIERSRSALSTSTLAGSDMIAIRVTICCCSVLASGEPAPSTSLMPNSVDGSVPARVIIEVRSCGSGRSAPRVTRIFCIVICPRAPDRPAQALRLGADLLVVDAHRRVDRRLRPSTGSARRWSPAPANRGCCRTPCPAASDRRRAGCSLPIGRRRSTSVSASRVCSSYLRAS